ncbi:485_t:CDS:1, partial [Funneliformis caledonium]
PQRGNSLSKNPPAYDDNIEDEDSTTEKLTFDLHIAKLSEQLQLIKIFERFQIYLLCV